MARYGLDTPLLTLEEHNEEHRLHTWWNGLAAVIRLPWFRNAGTPLLSDPGFGWSGLRRQPVSKS